MPDRVCPYCEHKGFVRSETVIKAGAAYQSLYCGHCERTWQSSDFERRAALRDDYANERPEPSRPKT